MTPEAVSPELTLAIAQRDDAEQRVRALVETLRQSHAQAQRDAEWIAYATDMLGGLNPTEAHDALEQGKRDAEEIARLRLKVEQYGRWFDECLPPDERDSADLARIPQSLLTLKAAANTAIGQRDAAEQRVRTLEAALREFADIGTDDEGRYEITRGMVQRARAALAPPAEGA